MATADQEEFTSSAGRAIGSTVRDLADYGPGFAASVEDKYNPVKAGARAGIAMLKGVGEFTSGVGAGFRGDPAPRATAAPAPVSKPVMPAVLPETKPTASVNPPRAAAVREIPSRVVRYTGPEHQPDNAPAFSYVDQLHRLQAIDPERYGGGADRSTWSGVIQDIRARKQAAAALTNAREDRRLSILERQPAEAGARAIALEQLKAGLEAPDKKSLADYRAAQAKLFAGQSTAQDQAATLTDLKIRALKDMYSGDPIRAKRAKEIYDRLSPRVDPGAPLSEERQVQEIAQRQASAGTLPEGYADGGVVSALPATSRGVAPAADRNPLIAQYGQYLAAAAKVGVPPVPFQKYMGLIESTRAAAQGAPAGFANGGDVEDTAGAIPVAGKMLHGPGTGTSDSIPAVINGKKPAALSDGEFVIPAVVVKAKGTEFFDKLIAPYLEKANAV